MSNIHAGGTMSEIVVVARGQVKPGSESAAEKAFLEVITPTHQESGCLRYALHRGLDDPSLFMMIERWSSREALNEHLATPHVARLFEALGELLAGPAEIVVLEPKSEHLGQKGSTA
jgi:quinol monooxygenase YgiN